MTSPNAARRRLVRASRATSWRGHLHRDAVFDAFILLVEGGRVGISTPTLLEQQLSARDAFDLARMRDDLISRLDRVPMPDAACLRAEEVQRLLVEAGQHRGVSVPDLLVAATAEQHGLTVLHFDRDFDTIAAVTGQPTRWILPGDQLRQNEPVGRRPRDTGLQVWLDRRPPNEPDVYAAGFVCATCRTAVGDHRDGNLLYAVDEEGDVITDRWVVTHKRCTHQWERQSPAYRCSWELSWMAVCLLRSLAVAEPEPGRFDLSDHVPEPV